MTWNAGERAYPRSSLLRRGVALQAAGKGDAALEWWRRLLALPALGANLRLQWLPEAIRAARDAGSMSDAEGWQAELLRLPPAAASGR